MISPAEHNGNENKRVRSRDLTMEDLIRDYIEFPQNVVLVPFAVERGEPLGRFVQLGGGLTKVRIKIVLEIKPETIMF